MSFPPSFCAPQHLEVLLDSLFCFRLLPCSLPLPQFLLFHKHTAYGPWGTLRLCYILPYKQAVHPPQHTHIFLLLRFPLMYIFTPGKRNDVWDPSFHGKNRLKLLFWWMCWQQAGSVGQTENDDLIWVSVCMCVCVHRCFQWSLALAFSWVFYEGKGHLLQECVSSVSAAEL